MSRKNRKYSSLIVLFIFVAALALAGCGSSASKTDAKPEGKPLKLTLYCGLMEDHMVKAIQEFQKDTGIKVDAVRMSSGEVLGRIKAEKNNPKASVWWGGPADAFIAGKQDGLFEKYVSPNAAKIPAKFKDADGYWTGIYVGYLGFSSNAKLLKEKGIPVPQTWQDLLRPELKGQVSMANPGASGTAYTMLATIVQLMGEEKGLEYMKKLNGQIKVYQKTGTAPARMAGQGEVTVGLTFINDANKNQ